MTNYVLADRDQNTVLFEDPTKASSTFRIKRNLGRKLVDELKLHNIRSEYVVAREVTPAGVTDSNIREPLTVRLITTGSDQNQAAIDKMIDTLFAAVVQLRVERAAGRLPSPDTVLTIDPVNT